MDPVQYVKKPFRPQEQVYLKCKPTTGLVGFEASGVVHLGHYLVLSQLKRYMNQQKIKGIVLISDLHAELNKKPRAKENAQRCVEFFESFLPSCELVISSDLIKNPSYWDLFLQFSQAIKLRSSFRALPTVEKAKPQNLLTLPFTYFLYPVFQCIDGHHLKADLLIAGIDQRNIYMQIYNHYNKLNWPKPNLHFLPLLNRTGGIGPLKEKMSSSKLNTPLDGHLYQQVIKALKSEPSKLDTFKNSNIHVTFNFDSFEEFLRVLKEDLQPVKNFYWD